jgi:general secretion pathway protein E
MRNTKAIQASKLPKPSWLKRMAQALGWVKRPVPSVKTKPSVSVKGSRNDPAALPSRPTSPSQPALSAIQKYAEIPAYLRVLTTGEDPIYRLSPEQQERLIATDLGAKRVNIIALEGVAQLPVAEQAAIQWQIKALKGELRAKGYQIVAELVTTREVMQHIAKHAGVRTQSGGRGEPLRLFNQWLELAVTAGATDVHVDIHGNVAQVRVRIDGALEPLPDGSGGSYPRLDAIDALAAGYNNTREGNNVSQYTEDKFVACMIGMNLPGVQGHLRYQNFKGRAGPKAVIRILRSGSENDITLAQAGYAPSHLKLLRSATRSGKGMVLIAGVTSSGKSTSLKCLIETLPNLNSQAVYTVEDPIEYTIHGAHQIEVLRDLADDELTNNRYADTMRALMRGDPDCVMLGEIRDKLTALFALQIAETGHLALGTVHAHLISTIIPRLTNDQIGVSRQALTGPGILNLLVYQALVPKLCGHCCLTTSGSLRDPEVAELVDLLQTKFQLTPAHLQSLRWQNPAGCPHCKQRGTQGKTLVAEVMRPSRAWLRHVRLGDDDAALTEYRSHANGDLHSPDMDGKTVFEHTFYQALQGHVDIRCCEEFEAFSRFDLHPLTGSNSDPVNRASPFSVVPVVPRS